MATTYGERVKERRKALGWSQSKLAQRVGSHAQTIDKIERGTIKFSRYLPKIDVALGLRKNGTVSADVPGGVPQHSELLVGDSDLPLYASSLGEDGHMHIGIALPMIHRPAPLFGITNAYAVIVSHDDMEPAFEVGDKALINPLAPPEPGKDVMLRGKGDAAHIYRLDGVTKDAWVVHVHSAPKKVMRVSKKEFPQCHRVIGKWSR